MASRALLKSPFVYQQQRQKLSKGLCKVIWPEGQISTPLAGHKTGESKLGKVCVGSLLTHLAAPKSWMSFAFQEVVSPLPFIRSGRCIPSKKVQFSSTIFVLKHLQCHFMCFKNWVYWLSRFKKFVKLISRK